MKQLGYFPLFRLCQIVIINKYKYKKEFFLQYASSEDKAHLFTPYVNK